MAVDLGGECLDGLQVEVEVKMEVVEILAVDQQVQHVVALSTDLQADLHPVQRRRLEELCRLERPEQVPTWNIQQACHFVHLMSNSTFHM